MINWVSDLLFWIFFGAILFSLRRQRIFLTVGALALLLLFNQFFTPGFFHIQLLNGHFYGSRIDVLNQGAKVMLLSLGMVLVIATGGVDLSVGAVMAIAAAVSSRLLVTEHQSAGVAIAVVIVELGVISWIRHHFMDTPLTSAAFQVVLGGIVAHFHAHRFKNPLCQFFGECMPGNVFNDHLKNTKVGIAIREFGTGWEYGRMLDAQRNRIGEPPRFQMSLQIAEQFGIGFKIKQATAHPQKMLNGQ